MRESFTEYKKTLEQNLINISYLYSGNILSSIDSQYTEIKNSPLISPIFMINSVVEIYNKSFQLMVDKSKEFVIPGEYISGVDSRGNSFYKLQGFVNRISEFGIKPVYIFCSEKGKKLFGPILKSQSNTSAFPYYFYNIEKAIGLNVEVFYSPLIQDDDDETIIYVADGAIQSLVYSIQNMDYTIDASDNGFTPNIPNKWNHIINYKLYDCNFNAYKLSIRNLSRIRNDKINKILNDN